MPLHTDLRPKTFDEFMGNIPTIKSLKSVLVREDRPHTYLFYGERGCGKTTLARILANYVECGENDTYEYNNSNTRGVDTARNIIETAPYRSLSGKNKCYILDEVHRTTLDFQSSMLKILEEPPVHVYFVLCTTNPEKLIKTILSRCRQYKVSPLSVDRLTKLLIRIRDTHNFNVTDELLMKIAEKTEGIPREALGVLDAIRDLKPHQMESAIDTVVLNDETAVFELCQMLLKGSWGKVETVLKGIRAEPETVRRAVLGYFEKVLLNGGNKRAAVIIECFENNFYDSGRSGLVLACYKTFF